MQGNARTGLNAAAPLPKRYVGCRPAPLRSNLPSVTERPCFPWPRGVGTSVRRAGMRNSRLKVAAWSHVRPVISEGEIEHEEAFRLRPAGHRAGCRTRICRQKSLC